MRRSTYLVSLPLVVVCGFGIAGIFSSYVSKAAGSSVLIKSDDCGNWLYVENLSTVFAIETKIVNVTLVAANYVRDCYGDALNTKGCNTYVQQQLKWTGNVTELCPFDESVCLLNDTVSFQMDTGHINSHENLGINAINENRITYRKVTTCAVIATQPFFSFSNTTSFDENYGVNLTEMIQYYNMGEFPAGKTTRTGTIYTPFMIMLAIH